MSRLWFASIAGKLKYIGKNLNTAITRSVIASIRKNSCSLRFAQFRMAFSEESMKDIYLNVV